MTSHRLGGTGEKPVPPSLLEPLPNNRQKFSNGVVVSAIREFVIRSLDKWGRLILLRMAMLQGKANL